MEKTQLQQKNLPKLTKKQRGFVNDYVETENGTQSALKNYDTKDYKTASVIAAENLDKPIIQVAIEVKRKTLKEALIEKGITEDFLADKVNVLLTAVDDKGQTDYTAVDKGLKHASSWYGVEDQTKPEGTKIYNFVFNQEVQKDVESINARIKEKLLNHEPNKTN